MIEEKDYKYILPGENNNPVEYQVKCHSMIIIGANGSGKSQLGAWIEKNNPNDTHRIGAQRALMLFSKLKDVTSGRLFYDDFDSL